MFSESYLKRNQFWSELTPRVQCTHWVNFLQLRSSCGSTNKNQVSLFLRSEYPTVLGWALRLLGLNAEEDANVASCKVIVTWMSNYLSSSEK
jgi:hypothetical protein